MFLKAMNAITGLSNHHLTVWLLFIYLIYKFNYLFIYINLIIYLFIYLHVFINLFNFAQLKKINKKFRQIDHYG